MSGIEARWIEWWCAPWQWVHLGWIERFMADSGWDVNDAPRLLHGQHNAFLSSVGVTPSQPPTPDEGVLQWLTLEPHQQVQALQLAASICLGQAISSEEGAHHEAWCRAVAKALRPGAWLEPTLRDPRLLLAAWAGEACWARLRLNWAPDTLSADVPDVPPTKLQTLWQAMLWRVRSV